MLLFTVLMLLSTVIIAAAAIIILFIVYGEPNTNTESTTDVLRIMREHQVMIYNITHYNNSITSTHIATINDSVDDIERTLRKSL